MTQVTVSASKAYEVQIGTALLDTVGEQVKKLEGKVQRVAVITDSNVAPLYLPRVETSLKNAGIATISYVFPAGEESKNGETYLSIVEWLASQELTRNACILALGGGVVGDLAGFVAATYLRGIAFIQVPTTLLAAVDSSVGGKTAIDLEAGKNLVGAFYQPRLVLCDLDTFDTLSPAVFADGCAEVIKYGMIRSANLLADLKGTHIKNQLEEVVAQCVGMKRDIVEADEFEQGERKLLNFGHTLGHAIEKQSKYSVSHGKAVAIGMVLITKAAVKQGVCPEECLTLLESLLEKYELPSNTVFSIEELFDGAMADKKRSGDSIDIVIPVAVGKSEIKRIDMEKLKHWIEMGKQ